MSTSRLLRLAAASTLTAAIGLVATGVQAGASAATPASTGHAVFVETDATANTIVSYQRAGDGTLSYAGTFLTGGAGAVAANAHADPLASQGGLTLVDQNRELIAVNPGSDTVSVFAVNGATLRLVQQIGSGGLFPDSVAVHGDLVAVLNAGGVGSVAEYRLHGGELVALADGVRSLGLDNTTPPDFTHGPGQVGFSPSGRFLIVATKLSGNAYAVFPVGEGGALAATATLTPAQNAVPFAFSFDSVGHLVGVEASNSSLSTYTINADGSLTALGTVSDNAGALCWVANARGVFYGANAASGTVSSFRVAPDGTPTLLAATAGVAHAGTTDSSASPDGRFLYVESGGAGTLDTYVVNQDGSLTALQTIWGLPIPYEGIAVS
jgi:6-phosphogluconolactonase (cycloisomerase 2 family)